MGLFSKDIASMDDLFVHQLQDIYYAEKRIVGALPDMIAKASSPELKSAFEAHLGQTKNHVKRVEQVFQMHGAQPKQVDCPAIDGILEEADEVGGEIERQEGSGRSTHRLGPSGRALRDDSIRHAHRVGENPGPRGLRQSPAAESRRRESRGREADHACGKRSQSSGGLTNRPSLNVERWRWLSIANVFRMH